MKNDVPDKGKKPRHRPKKSRSELYKANDEGGYCNPPVKHQFPLGGLAGPGRPKGPAGVEGAIRKMLRSKVTLANGPEIPMLEAFALATRKVMLSGGPRGIELGLKLAARFGPRPKETDQVKLDISELNDTELALFESLILRTSGEPAAPPDPEPLFGPNFSPLGSCKISVREDGHLTINQIEPRQKGARNQSP